METQNMYCDANRTEDLRPKVKKRGHGFTKALCKKAKQRRSNRC